MVLQLTIKMVLQIFIVQPTEHLSCGDILHKSAGLCNPESIREKCGLCRICTSHFKGCQFYAET